jgi:CRISPR-associated Csh1 family protein
MIKSFYTIGNILRKDEAYAEYFEPWSNPFPKVKDDEAKVVIASIEQGVLQEDLKEENFSKRRVNSYLYRKVQGANGTNLVPTFLFPTDRNFAKYSDNVRKLTKKVKQSVQNYKHSFINSKQIDVVEQKLLEYHQFIDFDKRYLFTIKVDGKYFGDFEEYKNLFKEDAYSKYYKDSSAKDKLCSVTYKQSEEVWGRVDTLGFTVDAATFSRNGFDTKDSYKMFPVSPDAVKVLEGAKRIILESDLNLTRNFYGLKYFILPHFIINNQSLIERIVQIYFRPNEEGISLKNEGKSIIYNEDFIHRILEKKELQESVYYDIFFYQPNNAQFLIKLHLSDVLPSRFKEIFDAKERVEDKYQPINRIVIKSKDEKSTGKPIDFQINFGGVFEQKMPPNYGIKDYFSKKVRTDTIFHPYFYKVLEAVFYGTSLNKETVLKAFMEKVVIAFKNVKDNPNDFTRHIKTSFTIYQFFNELKLFNSNIMAENIVQSNETIAVNLKSFIEQHDDFFPPDELVKKGAFYLGCLTEKMLSTQKKYYKFEKPYQEPFLKHLRNLSLDVKELRGLYNKLNTFQKYQSILEGYDYKEITELQGEASKYLAASSNLSRTELSYSFTLGMAMQREFVKDAIQRSKENKQKSAEKTK